MGRALPMAIWFAVSACAAQTRLPAPVRTAVTAAHVGRSVELRQSCYFGDLYDENEKWLLSPHPFADTHHIVDLDGKPIHPRGQHGIAPAGTQFTVVDVEFPTVTAVSMRMLTTPRYNPWVYLQPAPGTELPTDRSAFILLLPMDMESRDQVEAALNEVLAPAGEVTAWIEQRTPTIQVAIRHKDVIMGMTETELVAALGPPHRWYADAREEKRASVAWYPDREVWLTDGTVAAIQKARDPRPPQKPRKQAGKKN